MIWRVVTETIECLGFEGHHFSQVRKTRKVLSYFSLHSSTNLQQPLFQKYLLEDAPFDDQRRIQPSPDHMSGRNDFDGNWRIWLSPGDIFRRPAEEFYCLLNIFAEVSFHVNNIIHHSPDYIAGSMCPWCSGYPRRIGTRRYEFKSWTRLIAFHIALIPLGKVWIQLFSLQLWVNSRTD